jgi:hypothetical protein
MLFQSQFELILINEKRPLPFRRSRKNIYLDYLLLSREKFFDFIFVDDHFFVRVFAGNRVFNTFDYANMIFT